MKIKIEEMKQKCEDILVKRGISKKDAKIIVDEYIENELQEKLSHGLIAFPSLIERFNIPEEKWSIEKETHSTVFIDGKYNFGQIVGRAAVETICKKAEKEGVGLAEISNILPFLRPGTFAKMIADRDMIGIVVNNGGREMMVAEGGIDPVLATNPIGVGIPAKEEPIVFDMATSKHAWGEIKVAKILGRFLSDKTFLDKDGNFTMNPDEAYAVVPMGGYKGYALGLLIEILTGSLVNMPMGIRGKREDYRRSERGAVFIAINPSFFMNLEEFKKRNSELIKQIKSSRKADGVNEILIPGEMSRRKRLENLRKGYIEVSEKVIENINKLLIK
jgi:LDH2 family malate/lactate/ureidoglycolate dehydrogenase